MSGMHENIDTYLIAHKSEMDEQSRLKAYKRWPYKKDPKRPDILCYAEKMAEAGWVYVGGRGCPDAVRCFVCFKELEGWDDTDDPWEEHRKRAGDCPWALRGTPERERTVDEMLDVIAYRQKDNEDRKVKHRQQFESVVAEVKKWANLS